MGDEGVDRPAEGQADGLSRRTLVGAGAAAGLGIALAAPLPFAQASRTSQSRTRRQAIPLARTGEFAHGVASGLPNQRAVTLWTRLDGIERTSLVTLEVARDPDFRRVIHRERVRAAQIRDYVVNVRFSSRRLQPGRRYWYRFHTRNGSSMVGRFKTRVPPDSNEPIRIAFFSCQNYQAGYYTAHAAMAAERDLDLVLCLGDYIYETGGSDVRTDDVGESETLPEYRQKYQLYRSDPDLQAMHAAHPFLGVWDDHEVEDNWAAEHPGKRQFDRRLDFMERRRNGFLAFFEWMPQPRIAADRNRIYRALRFGRNAQLFALDTRQYRDQQPCDDAMFVPCGELDDPDRTMLGGSQKSWLLNGLESSRARWKLIGTQVMFTAIDVPNNNEVNKDQWDGYNHARNQIVDLIRGSDIRDVSFLTGDIHTFFAADVYHSGRQRLGGTGPVATEFVGGSITSHGIPAVIKNILGLPEDMPPQEVLAIVTERLPLVSPHLRYNEHVRKGYGLVEARPDELLVSFRSPRSIESPESDVETIARFRVESGDPRVQVLST